MIKQITPEELKKLLQDRKDIILIDTRTQLEHTARHLPNSILIPYEDTAKSWHKINAEKDAMIVVYCRSGNRSAIAAEILVKAGFTNVYNLEGGLIDWLVKDHTQYDKI